MAWPFGVPNDCLLPVRCTGLAPAERPGIFLRYDKMLTISQLAKRWGLSRSGVWNRINRGTLARGQWQPGVGCKGRVLVYHIDTPKPEPRTRNKRGRNSKPINTLVLETSWAMWPAPERAP